MKTKYMKKQILFIAIILGLMTLTCSSDDTNHEEEPKGNIMKLSDVVSNTAITELKENGMELYEGNTPPKITGIAELTPMQYDYTNTDYLGFGLGTENDGFRIQFSDQSSGNQSIKVKFIDYYLSNTELKSTFITGSDNKFTVCFILRKFGGPSAIWSFDYVYFISGIIDGTNIRNMKMATVGLKEKTPNQYNLSV